MSEKKTGSGFFGKLFGGRQGCCSIQIEEIKETPDQNSAQQTEAQIAKKACAEPPGKTK